MVTSVKGVCFRLHELRDSFSLNDSNAGSFWNALKKFSDICCRWPFNVESIFGCSCSLKLDPSILSGVGTGVPQTDLSKETLKKISPFCVEDCFKVMFTGVLETFSDLV